MTKTAVVIGATGVVGREVVNYLVHSDAYDRVVTLTRRPIISDSHKEENHVVDFDCLEDVKDLIQGDCFFSCLGTTKKQAGSIAAQRQVDYDYQLRAAELAAANKMPHYLLVSSSGANAKSFNAYLKMKGELEQAVEQLPFQSVRIFQPSLLLGEREDERMGEKIGAAIMPALCALPGLRKYKPITGKQVAKRMVSESVNETSGVSHYVLDEIF
ncbi:MAG: oxidoreductase [Candidatus Pelagadaptatus aseana]|uniref:NAD(P)H-binding protein n=1 Tax=Candidatus Pelagadaptatus aseana TaxID=3120508 RepID=UPI0039B216F9